MIMYLFKELMRAGCREIPRFFQMRSVHQIWQELWNSELSQEIDFEEVEINEMLFLFGHKALGISISEAREIDPDYI